MAIQIKKLGTRALTALFFVVVLLLCLLLNYYTFTLFFLVVAIWGLHEFFQIGEKQGLKPYRISGMSAGLLVYACFVNFSFLGAGTQSNFLVLIPVLMIIVFAGAIADKTEKPFSNAVWTVFGLIYAVLPFGLLHLSVNHGSVSVNNYAPEILLGIILLIWCNDTFAYLGGSIFGRNKMIERISPGKTWEGTISGLLCTFAGSFLLAHLLDAGSKGFWLVAGILVPILATAGDLFESILKRQAGIKDTGTIMPGHGGILDRFDSLIFVSPFVLLILELRL